MQADHYCEHFHNLKISKAIDLGQQLACKTCHIGKNYLWFCLAKNCGCLVCDRNKKEHIKMHLEQSKSKKSFHSIFINVFTAQIICIQCDIEIYDLDILKSNNNNRVLQDPFPLRLKILPSLAQFNAQKNKSTNFVIFSYGPTRKFRRTQKNQSQSDWVLQQQAQLCNKFSVTIFNAISIIQINSSYFETIEQVFEKQLRQIERLSQIFYQAQQANFRAIHTDELVNILISEKPQLTGYVRKDPFEHVIGLLTKVHELIKYYTLDYQDSGSDPWEYLGNPLTLSKPILNCPLFDNISTTLSLNYVCQKCKRQQSVPVNLNFLKLSFPKKKRKAKQVQKQLAQHRCESPLKNRRRNSLLSFFTPQQECPFTIPQLLIEFLKQPFYKDKMCSSCKQPMMKMKSHFQDLPEYLIIQVNRMGTDGNSVDQTKIQFNQEALDLGPFTIDKNSSCIYQFQTAICVENMCSYPVICKNKLNKQTIVFKNQLATFITSEKKNLNPYVLCYKRKCQTKLQARLKDCHHNIKSNIQIQQQQKQNKGILLPDFWLCQLRCNIQAALKNQMVCPHKKLKPGIQSKMKNPHRVPIEVYEYLLQMFKGQKYVDAECHICQNQIEKIKQRKTIEKQKIIEYEKVKTSLSVMISQSWIKKWINFLYKKTDFAYSCKGYPMPGPIDNKNLLEGQKCKANLHKNQDYKVVSIYVWRFLKQLYGGGPQIRYKWSKGELNQLEEDKIKQIKTIARQIKDIFTINYVESPKKSMIIQKTTSYVESVRGSEQGEELSLPQQIQ